MAKKSYILISLLIGSLMLTSINIGLLIYQNSGGYIVPIIKIENNPETSDFVYNPFVVGITRDPYTIDPAECIDVVSMNVIEQVCEGLFRYNLSDPDLPRINWLAESYWWEDETTLRLKLREGISFHDNTAFNAAAAKWNLDRINYLTNASGTLPGTTEVAITAVLWKFPNGTGIMKQIDYVSEYNITIHLNGPYSPFIDLLCVTSAQMISPTSQSQTGYIDLNTGDLIGTGPFLYDNLDPGIEVNFHAFDNYWRGEANITELQYQVISDPTARNMAMLFGDIDYLFSPSDTFYSSFIADPDIVFAEAPDSGFGYYYIGMNNEKINVTWRKAVSYAINYSHIIQEMRGSHDERAYSPIAPGFGDAYYNCSNIAPYYNLTIARQTLIDDPGINTTGLTANDNPDDTDWEDADLATFNYTYPNWGLWSDLSPVLVDWCDDIGITVLDVPLDYYEWQDFIENSRHKFSLFSSGWGPDYLDPYNMLDPLFSNSSEYNWASANDPWLQTKLEEATETTDDSTRNTIYHDIQIYLSSNLYPHAFLFYPRTYFVYNVNLTHYPHNALGKLYFYPCEWIPSYTIIPPEIIIDSPSANDGFVDIAPMFYLTIDALDYESIWYTLDNGVTNTTCGTSGQINSTLWNSLADNTYILRFYANNSHGLIGTRAISIYKDTTDPLITINEPDLGDKFTSTIPTYDITITEEHFASAWYTMDNGLTIIPLLTISGSIDEDEWNALPYGQVTIIFYAMDDVGNIGSSSVIVTKSAPSEAIPGFYPPLILFILSIGIIGFTWRKKHKLR